MTRRRSWRTALIVPLLVAGGCTGGSDKPAGTTPGPTASAAAPATSAPPAATPSPEAPVPAAIAPLPRSGRPPLPPGTVDPANFVATIDNPYHPLRPGTRLRYESGNEIVTIEVTRRTRSILGVPTVVVRDTVTVGGKLVEDTWDWFAQDRDGNVWYFGEDTKEYKNGKVSSTAGSWEAGVQGARAGIIMPAQPKVGYGYRQEYFKGEAEDMAKVLSLTERVRVPVGSYDQVVMTEEWTPLQPGVVERKYYARGVGFVLGRAVRGGSERLQLISVTGG